MRNAAEQTTCLRRLYGPGDAPSEHHSRWPATDKSVCHQLIAAVILPLKMTLSTGRQTQLQRLPKRALFTREVHPECASPVLRRGSDPEKSLLLCNVKRTLLISICSIW